ncbi:hypothetical protein DITRI_Ditri01bG0162500 [Diplodiscus trichospermus]
MTGRFSLHLGQIPARYMLYGKHTIPAAQIGLLHVPVCMDLCPNPQLLSRSFDPGDNNRKEKQRLQRTRSQSSCTCMEAVEGREASRTYGQ